MVITYLVFQVPTLILFQPTSLVLTFLFTGLLCTLSQAIPESEVTKVLTMVGPEGLGRHVRNALAGSYSFIGYDIRVVELMFSSKAKSVEVDRAEVDSSTTSESEGEAKESLAEIAEKVMKERVKVERIYREDGSKYWHIPQVDMTSN